MLALPMARLAVSVRTTHVGSMHSRARPRLAGPVRSSGTVVPGLCEIADQYDAVLLDQFGVLHDGKRSLAGAEDCFKRLAAAGKKLIVLSNTSRRRDFAVKRLPGLGFDPQALLGFVCSGEEAHAAMRESWRGRRVLWISWDDDCAPQPKRTASAHPCAACAHTSRLTFSRCRLRRSPSVAVGLSRRARTQARISGGGGLCALPRLDGAPRRLGGACSDRPPADRARWRAALPAGARAQRRAPRRTAGERDARPPDAMCQPGLSGHATQRRAGPHARSDRQAVRGAGRCGHLLWQAARQRDQTALYRRSPCDHPPLQKPTRLLKAACPPVPGGGPSLAAWMPKRGGGGALGPA